jgi:uncharacterized protein YebE (UPF0316 family)
MPDLSSFLLPLAIFVAEMAVVTISTMRIIFIARGLKTLAAGLGFFEITIWLFAIGQVMSNLDSPLCFAGFAGGFVTGNWLGMSLEQRLAIGSVLVRVITGLESQKLVDLLREAGCGVTRIGAHGLQGPVEIVFTVIPRRRLADVLALVRRFDADAFYSIDELQAHTNRVRRAAPVPTTKRSAEDASPVLQTLRRAA